MNNPFKFCCLRNNKDKKEKTPEKEFSFIWWKEIETQNKIFYTQPFRTKLNAKSIDEAKEKLINFVMGKMKLKIVLEEQFHESDLSKLNRSFEEINKEMENIFKKI